MHKSLTFRDYIPYGTENRLILSAIRNIIPIDMSNAEYIPYGTI